MSSSIQEGPNRLGKLSKSFGHMFNAVIWGTIITAAGKVPQKLFRGFVQLSSRQDWSTTHFFAVPLLSSPLYEVKIGEGRRGY